MLEAGCLCFAFQGRTELPTLVRIAVIKSVQKKHKLAIELLGLAKKSQLVIFMLSRKLEALERHCYGRVVTTARAMPITGKMVLVLDERV
jgi:hypothetical protein